MGLRLRDTLNSMEASIEYGILRVYHFDDVVREIELDIPKNITMQRQCNHIRTFKNSVCGLFINDKFKIVLRFNGTHDVLTTDNTLLKRFYSSVLNDKKLPMCFAGSFVSDTEEHPMYLCEVGNKPFLSVMNYPLVILLDPSDDVNAALIETARIRNDVGSILVKDSGTMGSALWVDFGYTKDIRMKGYKSLIQRGFIGGDLV